MLGSEYKTMSLSELKHRIYYDSKLLKLPGVISSSIIIHAILKDRECCKEEIERRRTE